MYFELYITLFMCLSLLAAGKSHIWASEMEWGTICHCIYWACCFWNLTAMWFNPLTSKIWLLILPSSCYTFPCKLVRRIWSSIELISCTWWIWVFSLPVCWTMCGWTDFELVAIRSIHNYMFFRTIDFLQSWFRQSIISASY